MDGGVDHPPPRVHTGRRLANPASESLHVVQHTEVGPVRGQVACMHTHTQIPHVRTNLSGSWLVGRWNGARRLRYGHEKAGERVSTLPLPFRSCVPGLLQCDARQWHWLRTHARTQPNARRACTVGQQQRIQVELVLRLHRVFLLLHDGLHRRLGWVSQPSHCAQPHNSTPSVAKQGGDSDRRTEVVCPLIGR